MPGAETTGGVRSAKLLQILFWAGVGLAPLAALLLLFGGGFVLQLAAVLAVGVVVLIGLSIALRPDHENVRSEIEEAMFEELDTLRDDIRGDITHAARATHSQLVERIGVLHETVDALRNQVDMMRGQLERTTRAAQQAAAQHGGPQPVGSAAVPQGVLRHTETVQVTTKTMVVDPADQRRDGTVYGARPVEIPQQRRPVGERVPDADWPQRPGEWADRDGQDWHEPGDRGRHEGGTGRVVDASHWSESADRTGRAGRQGWTDRGEDPDADRGRAGSHDRTGRGEWGARADEDAGRAERGRGDAGGRTGRWSDAEGGRAEGGRADGGRAEGGWSDGDAGRGRRGERADGGEGGGRRRRDERADRGDGDRGDYDRGDYGGRDRGDHGDRGDYDDRGERSRGHHADRGGRGEHTDRGDRDEQSDRTDRAWGAERISRSERTERSEWTERSERSEWIERSETPREESWTEQLLRERMARADADGPSRDVERSGGRRRAYDPDDDAGSVTGVRTTDRWASVHSDERGGRELRMGERRAAVHADETGTHVRIEDRWASVRHEEYPPADEPRRESPRRSEARREREQLREADTHWSESSYEEARRDDTGTTRWSEVRRDRPALGAAQAALPAAPPSRWQDPAPPREDERVSRRARHDDDEDYGWNGARDEPRSRPARQIVDFEGNDDRWR